MRVESDSWRERALGTRCLIQTLPRVALGLALLTTGVSAQDDGDWGTTVAGGVLGVYAGATVGSLGTILPCTQTSLGARCVRAATALSATIGATSGLLLGTAGSGGVADRAVSGAVGLGAGVVLGLVARPFFQRFGWHDVLAVGLVGGAIGTQPKGALVGAAVGTALGVVLWKALPELEMPDAVAAMLAGVMVGVLAGWMQDASASRSLPNGASPVLLFRLSI